MNDVSALLKLKINSDTGAGRLAGTRADFSPNLRATGSDAFEESLEKARSEEKRRFDTSKQRTGASVAPAARADAPRSARAENPPARAHPQKPEDRQTTVARVVVADRSVPEERPDNVPAAAAEAENPQSGAMAGRVETPSESTAVAEEKTADNTSKIAGDGEASGVADADIIVVADADADADADLNADVNADVNADAVLAQENILGMMGLPVAQAAQTSVPGMQNETGVPIEGDLSDLSVDDMVAGVTTKGGDGVMAATAESVLPVSGMVGAETGVVATGPSATMVVESALPDSGVVSAVAGAVALDSSALGVGVGVSEAKPEPALPGPGNSGTVAGAAVADTSATTGTAPLLMEVAASSEALPTDLSRPALAEHPGLSLQGDAQGKGGEGLPSTEAAVRANVQAGGGGDSGLLKASLKGMIGTEAKGGMAEDALKTAELLTARLTTPSNPAAGLVPAGGVQAAGAAVGHSGWQSLPGNLLGPGGAFATMQAQVGSPAFGEELAQKMSLFVSKSLHSAQLVLNPAELGPIEIKLQLHKDQAQIQVQTSVPLVRDLVEGSVQRLREMLAEQGINLARFDVGSRHSDRGDAQNGQSQNGEGRNAGGFGADEQEGIGKAQVLELISERLVDYYA